MGFSVHRHSQPERKIGLYESSLCRLQGAVKAGENSLHVSKAADKLRHAALALIKAKRSLIKEYPERDPKGRQLLNLQNEEQRWLSILIEEIIEEYGKADS
jgi:hypothetical protein